MTMSHTDPDALVRDYMTADGTLDEYLTAEALTRWTDEQLADDLINSWELDDPDHDGSGFSWMDRYADRDDLIEAVASFRHTWLGDRA
jgi:hypothetical protein